jgi:hypothetical protein
LVLESNKMNLLRELDPVRIDLGVWGQPVWRILSMLTPDT